ncbi:hypothetical protein ACE1CI_25075 [Aerosakkonemataceae cyanobacterium BLCC-F50]|uniref:Uncharacterized protein n=1 Tax=Floridaenema flaviceps BLCC-F50 TaxID=3153642 RepID=A0ABV4XX11_9CYAN
MAIKLWKFLTTDVRDLNWGQLTEGTKTGAEAAKAVSDLAKAFKEQKSNINAQTLKPNIIKDMVAIVFPTLFPLFPQALFNCIPKIFPVY